MIIVGNNHFPILELPFMSTVALVPSRASRWDLAAENIAVKIRWFGLVVGFLWANLEPRPGGHTATLNAILGLGTLYVLADTAYSLRGRVLLARHPLAISLLEAVFISLLCFYDGGLHSPFRYYYILSILCCAIRYTEAVTYTTCAIHCASFVMLYALLPEPSRQIRPLALTVVMLGWVTWAATALALLLKRVGHHLQELNEALQRERDTLEERVAARSRELEEAHAQMLHQEKMAAFGLLAAGIAHEVGNPLAAISSLIQLVTRRSAEPYTQEKLALAAGQLQRIQATLRELVHFSRPAASERTWSTPEELIDEALNIAKYYKRVRRRTIRTRIGAELPRVFVVRDQMIQAVLNLILNAIDATGPGGWIEVGARTENGQLILEVRDNGTGVQPQHHARLFQPHFTTKTHGTGLGLFVTRKLVQEHGGRVSFYSKPNQETAFQIHLPIPQSGDRDNGTEGETPQRRIGTTKTVPARSASHADQASAGENP